VNQDINNVVYKQYLISGYLFCNAKFYGTLYKYLSPLDRVSWLTLDEWAHEVKLSRIIKNMPVWKNGKYV